MAAPIRFSDAPLSNEGAASDCGGSGTLLRGDSGLSRPDAAVGSGEESSAFVGGASRAGWRGSNISGYSGREPLRCPEPQDGVDHGRNDHSDEMTPAKASIRGGNMSSYTLGGKKCPPFFISTPGHRADNEQINPLHHATATCSVHNSQDLRYSHRCSVERDDRIPLNRYCAAFWKDSRAEKTCGSGSHLHAPSLSRAISLTRSSSECYCGSPAGKNASSAASPLHPVAARVSHICESNKWLPRQFRSAGECLSSRETRERDSTGCKRTISSQTLLTELKNTTEDRLVEARIESEGVCQPERALSVILGTYTSKARVPFDDNELVDPGLSSSPGTARVDGAAVAQNTTTRTRLLYSSDSEKSDIERQLPNVSLPKTKGGYAEYCTNGKDLLSVSDGNRGTTQCSDSLGLSESLLLDFDVDDPSSSAHNEKLGAARPRRQDENGWQNARSSDSAQLSPQPEFSFAWSGSGGTTLSWSALEPRFLRSPPPSLWADLSAEDSDKPVAAGRSVHVKNASVPDRPASPSKDDIQATGVLGRAKRTVSCPLSFDVESICYETGDQEAFMPRRSSSKCWCCDKDERGLENQGSARMEIQQYLRLKERLDQRHRTPVPREDLKSDQSGLERDLDMATLDCSVAGMERHSNVVELFSNPGPSSLPRTADSLEEWFKEGLPAFYEDFSEDRHGTFHTMHLEADENKHCQLGKNISDRCEFSADDTDCSTSKEFCAAQEKTSNRTEKAGISGKSTPTMRSGVLNDTIPGDLYEFARCDNPTGAFEGSGESTGANKLGEGGLLVVPAPKAESAVISLLQPPRTVLKYASTKYSGMQLAEELDKFATGLSLNDVALVACRPVVRTSQLPCLDDVDFSKYVSSDTQSVPEALARMPRIVCNAALVRK